MVELPMLLQVEKLYYSVALVSLVGLKASCVLSQMHPPRATITRWLILLLILKGKKHILPEELTFDQLAIIELIIYMKNILDSDWLRAVKT